MINDNQTGNDWKQKLPLSMSKKNFFSLNYDIILKQQQNTWPSLLTHNLLKN